jgi:hypothetical protein
MTRPSETHQQNLFEEREPRVELPAVPMADLKILVEALLGEIAAKLANAETGESSHEQDRG